jgi:hypothetical protein
MPSLTVFISIALYYWYSIISLAGGMSLLLLYEGYEEQVYFACDFNARFFLAFADNAHNNINKIRGIHALEGNGKWKKNKKQMLLRM